MSPSTSHYISPLMETPAQENIVTTVLVSNLHCNSCVRTIEQALYSLSPPPTSVIVSIVSQSVTVHHSSDLSPRIIYLAVDEAGFDVADDGVEKPPHSNTSGVVSFIAGRRRRHVEQCMLCKEEADYADDYDTLPQDRKNIGADDHASLPYIEGISTEKLEIHPQIPTAVPSQTAAGPTRLSLSIGGMTCSSCTGTITGMVSEVPGVLDVTVSLIAKSAIVLVDRPDLADTVVETILDCGFEAELVSAEPVKPDNERTEPDDVREISLRVDGMFCHHCPEKVMTALEVFGTQVTIVKPLTDFHDPILKISYRPITPFFTIRAIVAAIAASKSPPFQVSIYHPPSLEERSRVMQRREQRHLLTRLIFSIIVAIPTFILGIVYMTLVKDGNPTKAFLMEPMWAGNVSRNEWALFFMATPVMFYSAGMFHRRSIKEIRSLWRKGSNTPILTRFTRFGSMNLLVSSGVSVAYFSSIALLALAAVHPTSPDGVGDNTTYFDSVVLLAMFLLAGRFLEAYSKARTADAITALGSLRPAKASVLVPRSLSEGSSDGQSESAVEEQDLEKGNVSLEDRSSATKAGIQVQDIDVAFLEVGDIVRVQNGSTPPADGTIVAGIESAFDESSLTGESRLIKKTIGDTVYLGTINKSGMVDIKVDAIGGSTMLEHIVKVVREGQTRRAPIERLADLLTGYFVPAVTLLAISTWVIWLGLGLGGVLPPSYLDIEVGGWTVWSLEFAIAVFVVACPCGIGLAAPTALLVGSGLAAKYGILARGGGEAFQEMAQVDVVVFDKTGTLTEGGEPKVSDSEIYSPAARFSREVVLGIANEIESATSHPLARAIRQFCQDSGNAFPHVGTAFEETAGRGLKARFETLDCVAIIGNGSWMDAHGVVLDSKVSERLESWKSEGKSVALLALQDITMSPDVQDCPFKIAALFAVADPLRPEAEAVIARLHGQGVGTWMISGDNVTTARTVAHRVGIPESNVIAGVLPHEKAEKIQWLQKVGEKRRPPRWQKLFNRHRLNERCIVAMVGDGINDAPALTAADIGIAIGSGSDVAISSASFILLSSNLRSLLTLCDLSQRVFNRVKFNFLWAVMYNLAALPVAAGVVYPAGHARLAPVWASLAMALSSVSVVCSSLLLKLYKEPKV